MDEDRTIELARDQARLEALARAQAQILAELDELVIRGWVLRAKLARDRQSLQDRAPAKI